MLPKYRFKAGSSLRDKSVLAGDQNQNGQSTISIPGSSLDFIVEGVQPIQASD